VGRWARLVSVEDNFDGSQPMGCCVIGILSLIAELEVERIKENWATAVSEAVGRGIHPHLCPAADWLPQCQQNREEAGRAREVAGGEGIREPFFDARLVFHLARSVPHGPEGSHALALQPGAWPRTRKPSSESMERSYGCRRPRRVRAFAPGKDLLCYSDRAIAASRLQPGGGA